LIDQTKKKKKKKKKRKLDTWPSCL